MWLPGQGTLEEGEALQYDPTVYDCMSSFGLDWPCLSFDLLRDHLGAPRSAFPHTLFLVAGTQAASLKNNYLAVMKVSNLTQGKHGQVRLRPSGGIGGKAQRRLGGRPSGLLRALLYWPAGWESAACATPTMVASVQRSTRLRNQGPGLQADSLDLLFPSSTFFCCPVRYLPQKAGGESDSDSDDAMSEEEEEESAQLHVRKVAHTGGINRVRACPQQQHIVASWAETAQVQVGRGECVSVCVVCVWGSLGFPARFSAKTQGGPRQGREAVQQTGGGRWAALTLEVPQNGGRQGEGGGLLGKGGAI